MKPLFTFLIFFASLFCKAQAALDTDGDGIPDTEDQCPTMAGTKERNGCPSREDICRKGYAEEKALYELLISEAKLADFSELPDAVFSHIQFERFTKPTLYLAFKNRGIECGTIDCPSRHNTTDPVFSEEQFYTQKILKKFRKTVRADIVPCISNFHFFNNSAPTLIGPEKNAPYDYTFMYVPKALAPTFVKIATPTSTIIEGKKKEFYYLPFGKRNLDLTNADSLSFEFENKPGNRINVKMYYNGEEENPQTLQFVYRDKKWVAQG